MPAPTPALITGTSGVASVSINALLYDCVLGMWRASAVKQFFNAVTFCGGGWISEFSGLKQIIGSAIGYLSHGNPISDPMLDFGTAVGVPVILQADTTCTLSFTGHIEKDLGTVAAGPSEFGIRFRSTGAATSVWNTST